MMPEERQNLPAVISGERVERNFSGGFFEFIPLSDLRRES